MSNNKERRNNMKTVVSEINDIKKVKLCEGCLHSDHCIDCVYLDTSKRESSGSRYFKCVKRGSYHSGDECCCSSFVRG